MFDEERVVAPKANKAPELPAGRCRTPARAGEAAKLRAAILDKLRYAVGRERAAARDHDWYVATALAIRDRVVTDPGHLTQKMDWHAACSIRSRVERPSSLSA